MSQLLESRVAYKPFNYPWAYDAFKVHEQAHWLPEEAPLNEDVNDWKNKLTEQEKSLLTHIFRFFTQGDIDVAGAYIEKYLPVFKQPEVRMMLLSFAAREAIHIDAYSKIIETLGMPDTTYSQFLEYDAMKNKHDYVQRYIDHTNKKTIAQQIAVFSAFTEGMQLFSSFIMLLNFTRRGLMKGMGQIITWSIIDESMHCEGMTTLFRTFIEENPHIWTDEFKKTLYQIARDMVELEDKFIDLAYELGEVDGLTAEEVKEYIRYIADRRLMALGLKPNWEVERNPLPWVNELLSLDPHENFFETRATSYAKGALTGSWSDVWAI